MGSQVPFRGQAENLCQLKEENKKTQKQICGDIKATEKTVASWIKGQKQPETYKLCALADYFNVSTDFILGRTEYRNLGNEDISKAIGLSEKSIEVLRFLNGLSVTNEEDKRHHRKVIDLINVVLEDTYSAMIAYRGSDDNPPVENIFSFMKDYIDPIETELSFYENGERKSLSGYAATIDSNGSPTMYTVNEIKRTVIIERIKASLTKLAGVISKKEGK